MKKLGDTQRLHFGKNVRRRMPKIELAISIRQPYVEQILLGVKSYEYRSTLTHIRGRVYLYAAKKPVDSVAEWRKVQSTPGELPTGVIVGSVEISGCEPRTNGGFRYKLEKPKRLRKYLVPKSQPTPRFLSRGCRPVACHPGRQSGSDFAVRLAKSPLRRSRRPETRAARRLRSWGQCPQDGIRCLLLGVHGQRGVY